MNLWLMGWKCETIFCLNQILKFREKRILLPELNANIPGLFGLPLANDHDSVQQHL